MTQWATNYYINCNTTTAFVEILTGLQWKVFYLFKEMRIPHLLAVDTPISSKGSDKGNRWSSIHIHFDATQLGALMKEGITRWIDKQLRPFNAVVGFMDLMKDPMALIIESTGMHAITTHLDLIGGCVIFSPTRAIISTNASDIIWKERITQQWRNNPMQSVDRLKKETFDIQWNHFYSDRRDPCASDGIQIERRLLICLFQEGPTYDITSHNCSEHRHSWACG